MLFVQTLSMNRAILLAIQQQVNITKLGERKRLRRSSFLINSTATMLCKANLYNTRWQQQPIFRRCNPKRTIPLPIHLFPQLLLYMLRVHEHKIRTKSRHKTSCTFTTNPCSIQHLKQGILLILLLPFLLA